MNSSLFASTHLRTPQIQAPPPPPSLKGMAASAWPMLDEPPKAVWPAEAADMTANEVGFSKDAIVVRLTYLAKRGNRRDFNRAENSPERQSWRLARAFAAPARVYEPVASSFHDPTRSRQPEASRKAGSFSKKW